MFPGRFAGMPTGAFLCYRGVNYAKWVFVGDIFEQNWTMKNPREEG